MGAWGPGLYSNDMAEDLKPAVRTLAGLPLTAEQIVEAMVGAYPSAAQHQEDEEHTTFWFVLADQLHRGGVEAADVFDRARSLLDRGVDAKTMVDLEMSKADLRARARGLKKLRDRLDAPLPKRRVRLKNPQPILLEPGELWAAPVTARGALPNPYEPDSFEPGGWLGMAVLGATHVFGFVAVYTVMVHPAGGPPSTERPTLSSLSSGSWRVGQPGTCSRQFVRQVGLERIGRVDLDPAEVRTATAHASRLVQTVATMGLPLVYGMLLGPVGRGSVVVRSLSMVRRS